MFMNCFSSLVCLNRLSLAVTSEIKYTEYCYNKKGKQRSLTSCQFYLIAKQQRCKKRSEDTIAGEKYMYIKQDFNQH